MDSDEIVQVLQHNGRFKDTYVGEILYGDEYYAPAPEDTPRTGDQILEWMDINGIEIQYGMDIDGYTCVEVYGANKRDPMVKYPSGKDALRQAVEFCMDMEDQNQ